MGDFRGFPLFSRPIVERFSEIVAPLADFYPIELNVLEYREERESNIDPHIDDEWLWGERIAGLNLLSPTVMTFSRRLGAELVEVDLPIPVNALYVMEGPARHDFMHGIKPEHIHGRRLVCTFRELTKQIEMEMPDFSKELRERASVYLDLSEN